MPVLGFFCIPSSSLYQLHAEASKCFSVSQALVSDSPSIYQRSWSASCLPYPSQGFKQEFHDPMYEQVNTLGDVDSSRYATGVVIKQEQMDYAFDTGRVQESRSVLYIYVCIIGLVSVLWT